MFALIVKKFCVFWFVLYLYTRVREPYSINKYVYLTYDKTMRRYIKLNAFIRCWLRLLFVLSLLIHTINFLKKLQNPKLLS